MVVQFTDVTVGKEGIALDQELRSMILPRLGIVPSRANLDNSVGGAPSRQIQ
jgi:hypothetical protein